MKAYRYICLLFTAWLFTLSGVGAFAHEVRPAFLKLEETAPATFSVIWKQPVVEGRRLSITPVFPKNCTQSTTKQTRNAGTVSETSELSCDLKAGFITLDGLERTLTDAFVEIAYLDSETVRALIKPSATSLDLGEPIAAAAPGYLKIGLEHIIFGWDHLLFVIGLALLVSGRQIWGVATAFTVAHSITLVLAALGLLAIPTRPVEILIAGSIALLGVEIIRKLRGIDSLATRRPYLISFMIGLIHGCGFASALSDIGLPKGTELLALLLFNVGVELGQFGVIAVFLLILAGIAKLGQQTLQRAQYATTYVIGTIAMYWVIDRLAQYWV